MIEGIYVGTPLEGADTKELNATITNEDRATPAGAPTQSATGEVETMEAYLKRCRDESVADGQQIVCNSATCCTNPVETSPPVQTGFFDAPLTADEAAKDEARRENARKMKEISQSIVLSLESLCRLAGAE